MLTNEIFGIITKLLYVDNNGMTRFSVHTKQKEVILNSYNDVICDFGLCNYQEKAPVKMTGIWNSNVFTVSQMELVFIDEKTTIDYIVSSCKGIGKVSAKKYFSFLNDTIFSYEKEELSAVLIEQFPNIKNTILKELIRVLAKENIAFTKLQKFLYPYGTSVKAVTQLYQTYHTDALERIKKNPYKIGWNNGLPFVICERIAYDLKVPTFSDERLHYLLMQALTVAADSDGHTYLPFSELSMYINKVLYKSPYLKNYPLSLIAYTLISNQNFIMNNKYIYLKKYWDAEISVVSTIQSMLNSSSSTGVTESDIEQAQKEMNVIFGTEQKISFDAIKTNGIKILTGGPGTGKTATIKGYINAYVSRHPGAQIELCAPTGRAAKRMMEATGHFARTIHKLIDFRPFEHGECLRKNRFNPIEADVIIVDEVSMVGLLLFYMLLDAIRPETLLILVGDENQLLSVGAGNILHDLIRSEKIPVYRLTENFRQSGTGSVFSNSNRILKGLYPVSDVSFEIRKIHTDVQAVDLILKEYEKQYNSKEPFSIQIIEPYYKGDAGITAVNKMIQAKYCEHISRYAGRPSIGDKVIFTDTDYENGYIKGEIGILTEENETEFVVWNGYENITAPISSRSDIMLAYSYTIHKAQGSETDTIILYLPDTPKILIHRSLLYTAVTRAKKKVIVITKNNALEIALANNEDIKRYSGLCEKLLQKKKTPADSY